MILDAVSEVQLFVVVFIGVYSLVLFVYVLTSWIQLPYSFNTVLRFLADVCDPYLRLWRRILPRTGPLDFSPMVALIALWVAEQLIVRLLERLH